MVRLYMFKGVLNLLVLLAISCSENNIKEFQMSDNLVSNFAKIKNINVYFGHQSVGNNIIDGLSNLLTENKIEDFKIIEVGEEAKTGSYLFHSKVGENSKPKSKCDAFSDFINGEKTDLIDVALLKFCYIDIDENTDIQDLFEYYKTTMDSLITKYPQIVFLHITVPLVHSPKGISIKAREWLGKPNRNKLANIKRNEFNNLIKQNYEADKIYDLAKVESTYQDGSRESFKKNNIEYFSLINEYSSDGRHLNLLGSKLAAQELIRMIAAHKTN